MKKQSAKIRLCFETLRRISDTSLSDAAGGAVTALTCANTCTTVTYKPPCTVRGCL